MPKAVVVLSGGQDSTTCLFVALRDGYDVVPITFDYGQRHQREINAAKRVVDIARQEVGFSRIDPHEIIMLGPILKSTSPLVSNAPLEQYKNHRSLPGGVEKTFVPMRNQLFLTIAMNRAIAAGATAIYTGVCEEDYGGYPDCRLTFIEALEIASSLGAFGDDTPENVAFVTPLMKLSKAASIGLALSMPGCYRALAHTHTSYDGRYPPLGHDHATLLRAKGFEEAGIPDPLVLRAWYEGLMNLPLAPNYADTDKYLVLAGLRGEEP